MLQSQLTPGLHPQIVTIVVDIGDIKTLEQLYSLEYHGVQDFIR